MIDIIKTELTFKQAYLELLAGYCIKRPMMKGWFFIDSLTGKLNIHLANGDIIEKGDLQTTIINVLADDWQVIRVSK